VSIQRQLDIHRIFSKDSVSGNQRQTTNNTCLAITGKIPPQRVLFALPIMMYISQMKKF